MMAFRVCALLFVVNAATLNSQVSPVQKVIELLDGLKAKVAAELAAEEVVMEEYTKWCDSEANAKEDAIRSNQRTANDLSATIEDAKGSIDALTTENNDLTARIAASEADLAAATKVRSGERDSFQAEEKELGETVDTLERAIIVLKRGQTSFMQKGPGAEQLSALAASLTKVVQATWVTSQERSVVQSLLQAQDGDEDLSLQPQASTAAYESKGGSILDILGDIKDKAEESLSNSRRTEMKSGHAFSMLEQSLKTETAQMQKRLSAVSNERSGDQESQSSAEGDLSTTETSVADDKAYLADLKHSCSAKATEWSERQQSASEEQAVIAKAKEILSSGVKVFLQEPAPVVDERREEVVRVLKTLASSEHLYALSQIATAAQSDPFGKVRGMIENMIARLLKEAGEEADAKAFCDTEISKSRAKQSDLAAKVDMHSVRVEKGAAAKAKLQSEIKALTEEVAALDQGTAESTNLRQMEAAEYAKSSAEYKQSADAVANAIETLQAYYSQGAFIQTSQAPEFGGSKTDIGSTIVSMLEVAESDFTRLLSEAEAAESAGKNAYKDLSQKNAVAKAGMTQAIAGKESEVKSLEMSLLNFKEDRASTSKELDAVLQYLDKLKPQCETKVMSFAERTARREKEIEGLKEALTILEA